MRQSIKRALTGLLIAGALALSAADAVGGGNSNGRDAFIGIIDGGCTGGPKGGGRYNACPSTTQTTQTVTLTGTARAAMAEMAHTTAVTTTKP
jgi:hypothetical protein